MYVHRITEVPQEKHGFCYTRNLQNLVKTRCGVECEVRGTSIFHKVIILNTATCINSTSRSAATHHNDKLALNTLGPLRWL